jgi:AAT family amino acid transporter
MFERIGLREAAGVINFVVITAALSSCNAGIFSGGRLLWALSANGYAPKRFAYLSNNGVPHRAVIGTVCVPMVGVILNYFVPDKAFHYMMAAVTFVGLMVWVAILYTHYRFRSSLSQKQLSELTYRAPWWPYSSWFALGFIFMVIGLMSFHEDARMALVVGPILLGLYLLLYFLLGLGKKEKLQLGEQK